MLGEISRSNPGPGPNTPPVPSWICDEDHKNPLSTFGHEDDGSGRCKYCWMPKGRWSNPAGSKGGERGE